MTVLLWEAKNGIRQGAHSVRKINGQSATLTPAFSLYLDFLRAGAAITVAFFHANEGMIAGGWLNFPWGQDAVMVFFVLSGFLIAYVSDTKERDVRSFSAARLARLWSILLPALALTPIFDAIGHWAWTQEYTSPALSPWLGF